jgi:hypothetical protein
MQIMVAHAHDITSGDVKTENIEVREFEMGTKELDKTLSRKLYETRGNATNCGMIYYYEYLTKIKIKQR